jgi:arsenate reductase
VNPLALETLAAQGLPATGFRSKSWDEFSGTDAPAMDFVLTVCDNAAKETCPVWPGHPVTAHWSVEDPAAVEGSRAEKLRAFERAYRDLEQRVQEFVTTRTS